MKVRTELLLYRMEWLVSKALTPTYRNLEESFEGWAYSRGLLAQVRRLEAQGLLESAPDARSGKRVHRLTEAGRRAAAGPRDPLAAWAAPWDGKWRIFLFDIPETRKSERRRLTRALAAAGCGCVQGSTWIAPATPPDLERLFDEDDRECSRLLLLLAESKGRRADRSLVTAAWDFEAINQRCRDHLAMLAGVSARTKPSTPEEWARWTALEHRSWHRAVAADPLLPEELLPPGYLGRKAFRERQDALATAAEALAELWPPPPK